MDDQTTDGQDQDTPKQDEVAGPGDPVPPAGDDGLGPMLRLKGTVTDAGGTALSVLGFEHVVNGFRSELNGIGHGVIQLNEHPAFTGAATTAKDVSEMHANLTLAYRHLEDARMRLGKVLQARDGGVSVYDK
ncbi:MAG: hypothetical protein IH951_11750 [Bacteroidetes bacterium]|nr:hypothetical protein [Bacteroidota bacterium]